MIIFGEEIDAEGIVFTLELAPSPTHYRTILKCYSLVEIMKKYHDSIKYQDNIYSTDPEEIKNENIVIECNPFQIKYIPDGTQETANDYLYHPSIYFLTFIRTRGVGAFGLSMDEYINTLVFIVQKDTTEQEVFDAMKNTTSKVLAARWSQFSRLYVCRYLYQNTDYIATENGRDISTFFYEDYSLDKGQILNSQQFEKYMDLSGQSVLNLMMSPECKVLRESAKLYQQSKRSCK